MTDRITLDDIGTVDTTRRDGYGRYLIVPPGGGKPEGYTRCTTIAKVLDDGGGLTAWKAAMAVSGVLMRRGLRAQWEALLAQHGDVWYSGKDVKAEAKRLIEEAAAVGGANDRSEVGTALHAITALVDAGHTPQHLSDEMRRDINAYTTGLGSRGIKVAPDAIELCTVLDGVKVAGTFDRIVTVPGFDLPLIADLKTGSNLSYSWNSIAVQLATYAHGDALYEQGSAADGSQDKRLPMPEVDQHWALVFWLNADSEGEAVLEVFFVDIDAGWTAFEQSLWTRDWRKSEPQRSFDEPLPTTDDNLLDMLEKSVAVLTPDRRLSLQRRIDWIGLNEFARPMLVDQWPEGLPTLRASDAHSDKQLDVIEQLLVDIERETFLPELPDEEHAADVARVVDLFPGASTTPTTTTTKRASQT